jgi:serine/threonine protein kinase
MKCPKCHFENPEDTRFCGNCATLLHPPEKIAVSTTETLQTPIKELTTGSTFAGRYQVIEELGKGGMGRVYKVLDKEIEEKVALKLLKPEIASDEETIKRFRNELKLARTISHKNICRMYDLGQAEGNYFITMEYVPGENLKSSIRRMGPLSPGKTIYIAKQVCEGLAEAHRLGVVHRDLKPQNIMIDQDGNARIMDFGIARSLKAKGITGGGVMIGTPEYMSPEQVEGKEADQRSDIYALGVILYEMVTGRVPFEGDTPLSVALKQKTEMPQDPRKLNAQIPESFSRLILKCLEKDKEKRYQGTEDLFSELDKIEKGIPITERILPKRTAATEAIRRINWKKIAAYMGISALLILLIAGGIYLFKPKAGPINSVAVLPFGVETQAPEIQYIGDGLTESLISMLSQLPRLKVISSFSVLQYKGKKIDLDEVGQDLNVKAVLTGRVSQRGESLSIIAELINVRDKSRIWGEQYNRRVGDIFALQEEISKEISKNLRLRLSGEEKKVLTKRYTENLEAYKLYLQGRFYWNRRTPVDIQKAIECFEKAVAIDPSYALGYASLAETYAAIGSLLWQPSSIVFPKSEEYALKALAIDDKLAEAHTALGAVKHWWNWDLPGAEKELRRAIQLNPNYATAHQWLAELYMVTDRLDLAHEEILKAQELDPNAIIMKVVEGTSFLPQGRFDEVIKILKSVAEENPDFDAAREVLVHACIGKKAYDEALKYAEEMRDPAFRDNLKVRILAARGEIEEARALLKRSLEIYRERYFDPGLLALAYGDLGEVDEAIRLLQQSFEQRTPGIFAPKLYLGSEKLTQDPRYKEIMKKVGIRP